MVEEYTPGRERLAYISILFAKMQVHFMAESTRRNLLKQVAAFGLGTLASNESIAFSEKSAEHVEMGQPDFFPGLRQFKTSTSGAVINAVMGGKGPGLLLLHGYPQTHIMWRKIAAQLAGHFTVVIPDLRGYGDSSKPVGERGHSAYSKRAMAQDQIELMGSLGFKKFAVVGHDRGGGRPICG